MATLGQPPQHVFFEPRHGARADLHVGVETDLFAAADRCALASVQRELRPDAFAEAEAAWLRPSMVADKVHVFAS